MSQTVEMPRRLNLGCGDDYRDGWHNVDIAAAVNPDQELDAGQPWDLPSNHFDAIHAQHVLEHLPPEGVLTAMREAARVLRANGTLRVDVPLGIDADTDPTHRNTWTWETPEYFTESGPYEWEAGCEFVLADRRVNVWSQPPRGWHGWRQRYLNEKLNWQLATTGPGKWLSDYPYLSGELTAVYRRQP